MRVLVQRVSRSSVAVDRRVVGQIEEGLLLLIGIHRDDDEKALHFCAEKCVHLRIFADDEGKMNRSLLDVGGAALAISQFTLYGDCRKGRRPGFEQAARPEQAAKLYTRFVELLTEQGVAVECGVFGADMQVEIHNDGPVTLMVESPV
ncbi:MAG: D-tyrosyl-tRNA(Tyr) deacylase [Candidatus Latescibacterota bacterium]|jgi:D-tyrosyl-tRNA(Tyr) deacylase